MNNSEIITAIRTAISNGYTHVYGSEASGFENSLASNSLARGADYAELAMRQEHGIEDDEKTPVYLWVWDLKEELAMYEAGHRSDNNQ